MNRKNAKLLAIAAGLISASFLLRGRIKPALWSASLITLPLWLLRSKYNLLGRSVVITGGSRGLGLALAEAFLAEGAKVTLLSRDEEELNRARHHLLAYFGSSAESDILALPCDVTNENQLKECLGTIRQNFDRIDVFINNAGSVLVAPFETFGREDYEAQMKIHFYASVQATQALLPIFKEQKEGRIINISSIGGKFGVPHLSGYCASKFALAGFSQSVQAELKKFNIHVMTVYPGLMRTGSPAQAVFKGSHEKEFAWFSIFGLMPGLTISPGAAADRIIEAVKNNEYEVIISPFAKLAVFAHGVFRDFFADFNALFDRLLPYGLSKRRKTGAASQNWLSKQPWGRTFQSSLHEVQQKYNEKESFNPRFNLNLES